MMLSGGALDPHTAVDQPVHLRPVHRNALLIQIFHHIAVGRFGGQRAQGSGLEHILMSEKIFGVFVHSALHFARKVQVNIRRFVTVEAQEGFKGNVLTVLRHQRSAMGTVFIRHVKARSHRSVLHKNRIPALGATVVRREGIHFGNTRHGGHKGGANRATGPYQIPLRLAEPHQLLGNHIEHRKSV